MSGLAFRPEKLFRYKKPALGEPKYLPSGSVYFLGLARFAFPKLKMADVDLLRILICFQMLFLQIRFAYQMINIRFQRFAEDWYRQRWERCRRQMRQAGAFMLLLATVTNDLLSKF